MNLNTKLKKPFPVWPLALGASILIPVVFLLFGNSENLSDILTATMAGALGTVFFMAKAHAENARFMKELFEHFNTRYSDLNEHLYKYAICEEQKLEDQDVKHIQDYFNLCAEEWVFWKLGYIYDPVWTAWHNGMQTYAKNLAITELWQKESPHNSYYGFLLPVPPQVVKSPSSDI